MNQPKAPIMGDFLSARISHLLALWHQGVVGAWLAALYALASFYVFVRDDWWRPAKSANWTLIAMIPHLTFAWWLAGLLAVTGMWLFEASFRYQLRLIGRRDLEHLLNGRFLGNAFIYGAEIVPCAMYKGKFDFRRLENLFDLVTVIAPPKSRAEIKFMFSNTRQPLAKFDFYILDGKGEETLCNVYERPWVLLDDKSRFSLKMTHEDSYEIAESASLWVTVLSWKK